MRGRGRGRGSEGEGEGEGEGGRGRGRGRGEGEGGSESEGVSVASLHLRHVGVQEVGLSGADVRHGADQSLPEAQQVVDTVG